MIFTHPTCELCGTKHMQGQHCWNPTSVSDGTTTASQDAKASGVRTEELLEALATAEDILRNSQIRCGNWEERAAEWLAAYEAIKQNEGRV